MNMDKTPIAGDTVRVKQCGSVGIVNHLIVDRGSHKPFMCEVKLDGVLMKFYLSEVEVI